MNDLAEQCAIYAQAIMDRNKEISELRADAERYRLLRTFHVDSYIACGSHADLDAEIDAALAREAP